MRLTLPRVAIGALVLVVLLLRADRVGLIQLRTPPGDQPATQAISSPATRGVSAAPQSAGINEQAGGAAQTNPGTMVRQDQIPAPNDGAKMPEAGRVNSETGLEPAGQPPTQAAKLPPQPGGDAPRALR
jgi:hypothetical protein